MTCILAAQPFWPCRGPLIYRKLMVSLNWPPRFSFAAAINANPFVYAHHVASFTIRHSPEIDGVAQS